MRVLSVILAGLIQIFGSFLFAQQYTSGYSTGYKSDPYQPTRSYPLVVYHPEPASMTCLTCNDCQVVNQPVVLPVATVIRLQGKRQTAEEVALQWEIFSDNSLSKITLLWSEGEDFEALWQGNRGAEEAFLHQAAPASILMYQLVATDQDGHLHYSNIVEISTSDENKDLLLYPNPGSDRLWLRVNGLAGRGEVVMWDLQGREVIRQATEVSGDQIEVKVPASLSKGIYLVELRASTNSWRGQWIHQ